MKHLWKINLILALLTLLFVGCGNGGDSSEVIVTKNITLPKCLNNNKSNGYLIQQAGTIKKLETNTTLEIWHFANSDKVVCVKNGKAIFIKD